MKAIHLIAIFFFIGLMIIGTSLFYSVESMKTFFTYLSWTEFLIFSFLITFAFNDQKMIIRILIFVATIILLGGVYIILGQIFGLNMLFVNYIILIFFLLFVALLLMQTPSQSSKTDKTVPANPIKHIIAGRITNESQLMLFFEEQKKENNSYETFVRSALSFARETLDNDQWEIVNNLLEPIVSEFHEQQPFSKLLKGQEKEMIHHIYRLTNLSAFPNKESVIFHISGH